MFFTLKRGMVFVDKGDPIAADFNLGMLTLDGNYHELDLSGVIPVGTKLVMIRLHIEGLEGPLIYSFRKKGNTNEINIHKFVGYTIAGEGDGTVFVACSSDLKIEYNLPSNEYTCCDLTVGGWIV
ncbi:hypothetical protein ES705_20903 [subsurface metagenome]